MAPTIRSPFQSLRCCCRKYVRRFADFETFGQQRHSKDDALNFDALPADQS